jgi:outer membrane protein assembly factor BamB
MTAEFDPTADHPPVRVRWLPLVLILGIAGAVLSAMWTSEPDDPAPRVAATQILIALVCLLVLAWAVLFSRFPQRIRLGVLGTAAALAVLGAALFRYEGVRGDLWLDLRWRGASHEVAEAQVQGEAGVDLSQQGPHDSPQFLGPERNGVIEGVTLNTDWEKNPPREVWRHAVGPAWSSYAIVGPYILTQDQRDDTQHVVCSDLATGNTLWDTVPQGATAYHAPGSIAGDGPRATPTVDGQFVYTMDGNGQLCCLDGHDGKVVWSVEVLATNGAQNNEWGTSCSPLVVDRLVVVSAGGRDNRSLVAYDKQTGAFAWGAGTDLQSYSSPILATLAGQSQIVSLNKDSVTGHDPATGEILWTHAWVNEESNCANPMVLPEDRILITSGYGMGSTVFQVARDEAGKFATQEIWRNRELKTKFSNPVVHKGYAYGLDDKILACVDLATGERKWKKGRYEYGQLILVGDVLVVQAESGEVVLVAADPEAHRELARLPALPDKTWNVPAVSGKYLLVRNDREAACYELPLATPAETETAGR